MYRTLLATQRTAIYIASNISNEGLTSQEYRYHITIRLLAKTNWISVMIIFLIYFIVTIYTWHKALLALSYFIIELLHWPIITAPIMGIYSHQSFHNMQNCNLKRLKALYTKGSRVSKHVAKLDLRGQWTAVHQWRNNALRSKRQKELASRSWKLITLDI